MLTKKKKKKLVVADFYAELIFSTSIATSMDTCLYISTELKMQQIQSYAMLVKVNVQSCQNSDLMTKA